MPTTPNNRPSFLRRYVWVPIAVMVLITLFGGLATRERGGLTDALPALMRAANAQPASPSQQHASPAPAMHALASSATQPGAVVAAATKPSNSTAARPKNDGTLHRTDFDTLSAFRWVDPPVGAWNSAAKKTPTTRPANQIPAEVRALDNQTVALKGFMYPLDAEKGKTREFILMRVVPACLYCNPPRINEFVVVKTADSQRVTIDMDNTVTVTGVMTVGEEYEDGVVTSIYRLSATAVK